MAYRGAQSIVGFGAESTWNTGVSSTVWFELVSQSMAAVQDWQERGVLYEGASGTARATSKYNKGATYAGQVVFQARYEGMGLIIKHALWASATSGPSGGLYTHTYTLGSAAPTGGLTMELQRGTGSYELYTGCRIAKMTMAVALGGVMTVTLDLIAGGRDARTTSSPTSPALTTNLHNVVKHNQAGTLGWNSVTSYLTGFRLELDNKLAARPYLGSLGTLDPAVPTGTRSVMLTADNEWAADDYDAGHQAGTESDAAITFTGASSNTLTATVQNAFISANSAPVSSYGIVSETSTYKGQDDGSDLGLKIVVVNSQSTAVAA